MKTLLTLLVLLFSSSVFAGEGDVYNCESITFLEVHNVGATSNFPKEKFTFLKENNKLIFNKGGFFNDYSMNVDQELQFGEVFVANALFAVLVYNDGKMTYTIHSITDDTEDLFITSMVARCEII